MRVCNQKKVSVKDKWNTNVRLCPEDLRYRKLYSKGKTMKDKKKVEQEVDTCVPTPKC